MDVVLRGITLRLFWMQTWICSMCFRVWCAWVIFDFPPNYFSIFCGFVVFFPGFPLLCFPLGALGDHTGLSDPSFVLLGGFLTKD